MSPDGGGAGGALAVRLRAAIARHLDDMTTPGDTLGVAVSGGGDSVALFLLLSDLAAVRGLRLHAVTVDHRLRPEAADEARSVAAMAARLGHPHDTLGWCGWDGAGNLQDAARRARYALMTDWARSRDIGKIALGHTADDQAETVLMRLGRAAGVDGLSGMKARREVDGIALLRPMLDLRRDDLRAYLTARGEGWADDPSNDDPAYDRIRVRQAMADLEPLGLTVPALAQVASNMADIRAALDHTVRQALRDHATITCSGDLLFDRAAFAALPVELRRRIALAALRWIAGPGYPPRGVALSGFLDRLAAGGAATLAGCHARAEGVVLRFCREAGAVAACRAAPGATWDGRWRLTGPDAAGAEVRALGPEGLARCDAWRDTGHPRLSLIATPALWRDDTLLAAPLAGGRNGWQAHLLRGRDALDVAAAAH